METYYSIGEAAKAAHTTSETLRHYDRIGLVKPGKKDEWSKYRYYTEQDIVRLNTVRVLRMMDLSLQEIKRVLEYDDLEKIVDFLAEAEKKADQKMEALQYGKSKIRLAKADYERKLAESKRAEGTWVNVFPERVILLSDTMEVPAPDNLWNYLGHFYDQVPPALKGQFSFEDLAGIYAENGLTRLFAVCTRYADLDGLKALPPGKYLCANCSEENRTATLDRLIAQASAEYGATAHFALQLIVVSGVLKWNYQIQVPLFAAEEQGGGE